MAKYHRYLIRPLRQNANDLKALAQLERDCVQGTDMKLCFGSDPPRHSKFTEWIVLVCEEKTTGQVIGCLSANIRSVLFYPEIHRFEKVSWIFNIRVGILHRRCGVATMLLREMQKTLMEKGVTFVYAGTSFDNVPSQQLLQKFDFKPVWTAPTCGLTLGHVIRILLRNNSKLANISTKKLDTKQSEAYLRNKFAGTFMLPSEGYPIGGNVYLAKFGDINEISVAVSKAPEVWTFVQVPLWNRLKSVFYAFLSWLLPRYFERPLPFGKPWRLQVACPFHVNLKNRTLFEPLLEALFAEIVRDLHKTTDALMIHTVPNISNLDGNLAEIVRGSKYVSPTLFKAGGLLMFAKTIKTDPMEAEEMENHALKQPFWFIDANEL